jgi:predicted tellurium resistance membrane protein TerC
LTTEALPARSQRLHYLRQGLAILLVFTAAKMIAGAWVVISPAASVGIIGMVLFVTVLASVWPRRPFHPEV